MKILVDARHLNHPRQSGIGEYTVQLLAALFQIDRKNHYSLLTTGLRRPNFSYLIKNPNQIAHLHRRLPNKLINPSIVLTHQPALEEIAGQKADIIFLPNLNFAAWPVNRPAVLTVHDLSFALFPEFYSRRMQLWHSLVKPRRLVSQAAHIICPSQNTKQDLVRLFGKNANQISVIPHGRHPDFHPLTDARDHYLKIKYNLPSDFAFFLGTFEPRKNILTLLQGLREYRSVFGHDLHLVLAGGPGWKSKKIRALIREPEYSAWVHCLDYLPAADRPGLLRLARVFLWPSIYEGFGLPILEALACGTPVITAHTSSLPEITGSAALLIDPYNSRDLAQALNQIFIDNKFTGQLSKQGLTQAKKFSWAKTAEQTLAIFEKHA